MAEGDSLYKHIVIDLRNLADEIEAETTLIDRIIQELQKRLEVSRSHHDQPRDAAMRGGYEAGMELAIAIVKREAKQEAITKLAHASR